jgi:hypothetical protein
VQRKYLLAMILHHVCRQALGRGDELVDGNLHDTR